MPVESGAEDTPLNPNELLTYDGRLVQLAVKDDKFVVNGLELPLEEIQGWIAPGTRISTDSPTAKQVAAEYNEMGWALKLGDLTLKGYKDKQRSNRHYLIITDSTGTPRAEFDTAFLLALAEKHHS
jgi:hypothetical protein